MKKLVLIFCLVMLPLTLASDTQHRFKVYVAVSGDDEQSVNTIESHLKRELRLLGDVDVVGKTDDWGEILYIYVMAMEWKDGTKTGSFAIATYTATRLPKDMYKNPESYKFFQATSVGKLGVAYYPRDSLHEFCINHVGHFDKSRLENFRSVLRRLKR